MTLVTPSQNVTLYQIGDDVEGASFRDGHDNDHFSLGIGASFNNFLDALDGSYCRFQGGTLFIGNGVQIQPISCAR